MLERPMTTPEIPAQHSYVPTVDAKTKALLAAMSEWAPALGGLLDRALRDGAISPDTVHALERAAWSLNADIAGQIDRAAAVIRDTTLTTDLNRLGSLVSTLSHEAARIERVVTPPPPATVTDWRLTRWAFLIGVAVGAIGIAWVLTHR